MIRAVDSAALLIEVGPPRRAAAPRDASVPGGARADARGCHGGDSRAASVAFVAAVGVWPGVEPAGELASAAREQRLLTIELTRDWAVLRRRAQASREQSRRERARLDGIAATLLALTKGQ